MNFNDLPLFTMLKGRLGYLNERQRLIAENVANSDTPDFAPKDLQPFTIKAPANSPLALAPVASAASTDPAHLPIAFATPGGGQKWTPKTMPDSETRLDGNQVVLEEQMMKMNDSRMNYNAAISFYEQSMNLIQTAIRIPGKG
jgi:flagellar basal-body rod protein FlgB